VALRPDGKQIAFGLTSGETIQKDIPGGGKVQCETTAGEPASIEALAYSSTGALASAHSNRIEIDRRLISQLDTVALAFRPDGQLLAAGLRNGWVQILDRNGIEKKELQHSKSPVRGLAWARNTLAAVSREAGAIRVWDDEGNVKLSEDGQPNGGNAGVSLSPDGSLMATLGLADRQSEVWNVASRAPWLILRTPPAKEAELTVARFVDGSRLLIAYKNGMVRMFALDPRGLKEEAAAFLKTRPCERTR